MSSKTQQATPAPALLPNSNGLDPVQYWGITKKSEIDLNGPEFRVVGPFTWDTQVNNCAAVTKSEAIAHAIADALSLKAQWYKINRVEENGPAGVDYCAVSAGEVDPVGMFPVAYVKWGDLALKITEFLNPTPDKSCVMKMKEDRREIPARLYDRLAKLMGGLAGDVLDLVEATSVPEYESRLPATIKLVKKLFRAKRTEMWEYLRTYDPSANSCEGGVKEETDPLSVN